MANCTRSIKYEGNNTAVYERHPLYPNTCGNPPSHSSGHYPSASGRWTDENVLFDDRLLVNVVDDPHRHIEDT